MWGDRIRIGGGLGLAVGQPPVDETRKFSQSGKIEQINLILGTGQYSLVA